MPNLNILETFRTKEELLNYFDEIGQNITEEEIENLKKNYEQTEGITGDLSLQQLEDVAGGMKRAHTGKNPLAKRTEYTTNGMVRPFSGENRLNPESKRVEPCDPTSGVPIQQHTEVHGDFPFYLLDGCPVSMIGEIQAIGNVPGGGTLYETEKNGETHYFYQKGYNYTKIKDFTFDPITCRIISLSYRP